MSSRQSRSRIRQPVRSGAGLIALLLSAATVVGACDGPSPIGYRERAGSNAGAAGSSVLPSAGEPGDGGDGAGGDDSGGSGGNGQGGSGGSAGTASGGRGGSAGSAGGGKGGSGGSGGGSGVTCGDGKTEGTEECDDGNTTDFDGCSSVCRSSCEACLDEFYADEGDYQYLRDFCLTSTEVATDGPSAGQQRGLLCQNLVRCFRTSGCAEAAAKRSPPSLVDTCYCGVGVAPSACEAGQAAGPCVKEIGLAAESKDAATIVNALFDNPTLALGVANSLLRQEVEAGYCVAACSFDRPVDECDRCAAGDEREFGFPILAPCSTCFAPAGCLLEVSDCVKEHCAAGDLAPCLETNGPCAAQLNGADAVLLANTVDDLSCRAAKCAAECFAN